MAEMQQLVTAAAPELNPKAVRVNEGGVGLLYV